MTGRRASDWLRSTAAGGESERRDADRRGTDRRAPRRRIDPLFAATLINQVVPADDYVVEAYEPRAAAPRRGVKINLRA